MSVLYGPSGRQAHISVNVAFRWEAASKAADNTAADAGGTVDAGDHAAVTDRGVPRGRDADNPTWGVRP
jgi:hypothetical protein